MNFKITSIETIQEMLYLNVEFLDDAGKPLHHEDFIMQISPDQDVEAAILQNITTFINGGFEGLPEDNRDYRIQPDNVDPLGLKEAPKVIDLIGVVKDETGK